MYDKRIYRIAIYTILGICITMIVVQTARLFYIRNIANQQHMILEQERIRQRILMQYPAAVHYINTHVHTDDFSSMLNFRLHDQQNLKILLSKDEMQAGRYKRRVQIPVKHISHIMQIMDRIISIDSSICHIEKLICEKRKNQILITIDLLYIHE